MPESPDAPSERQPSGEQPPVGPEGQSQGPLAGDQGAPAGRPEGAAVPEGGAPENETGRLVMTEEEIAAWRRRRQAEAAAAPGAGRTPGKGRSVLHKVSVSQVLLVVNAIVVVLVVVVLLGVFSGTPREVSAVPEPVPPPEVLPTSRPLETPAEPARDSAVLPEAVSWPQAEEAFQSRAYESALRRYRDLYRLAQERPSDELIANLLLLRIGECQEGLGHAGPARESLLAAAQARSPVVRAAACFHLALLDARGGQHLLGRMRAYQAISALGPLDRPSPLEADCDFLIGRCLTAKSLSFYNTDVAVAWDDRTRGDLFAGLKEEPLRRLLAEGADRPGQPLLGPTVQPAEGYARRLWAAACSQAPLEDLLARLADQTGSDVRWVGVAEPVRRRAVAVAFAAVPEQRLAEVACGMAGLVARFTGLEVLVYDPPALESLADQRDLLTREAVSAWQRFLLRYPDDARLSQAHLALAGLQESSGDIQEALQEYQRVAHRFGNTAEAPTGLLRSARLRIDLRDYAGARADLLSLLDRYPDRVETDRVYLYLGQATRKAGLLDESIRAFRKLYYMNLSPASQAAACLGAGRCFFEKAQYDESAKWLTRYVGLVKEPANGELAEAHLLLGLCAVRQNKADDAVAAFRRVLGSAPSREQRFQAVVEMARAEATSNRFAAAVAALDELARESLTPRQGYEYLLAYSAIHRAMGLPEKALSALRGGIEGVGDPELRAMLGVEMGRCLAELGELQAAQKVLSESLPHLGTAPAAYEAGVELASVCLRLGKTSEAAAVARGVTGASCPQEVRRRALEILGGAYLAQRDYRRAALAYSGMPDEKTGGTNE